MTILSSRSFMSTQSLGGEAGLVAPGFDALLHDGTTAGDFLAKRRNRRAARRDPSPESLRGSPALLANAFGVGSEANRRSRPGSARAIACRRRASASPKRRNRQPTRLPYNDDLIRCVGPRAWRWR